MAAVAIHGRAEELANVARFFDVAPTGPRALLFDGEPGIGKTTVWLESVRIAKGRGRVLQSRAAEAEAKLSFTVLSDLLTPALNEIRSELPTPQRKALEVALLVAEPEGQRPDTRAVSLGVLETIRALARQSPLTVAIDDTHWIDAPSAQVLSFSLRRLVDEPVTVLAATRATEGERDMLNLAKNLPELERVPLGPLPPSHLRRLLRRLGRALPLPLVARIHEASGGNPFIALEIGRALLLKGVHPRPLEPLPVPEDLDVLLRDRLARLPADIQETLLIVALSAVPTIELVGAMGRSEAHLPIAEKAGIVVTSGSAVSFTHPLLASAVYAEAAPSSRRGVHRQLAEHTTNQEERARHLALASEGPSAEVAAALDEAARRARSRGAPQTGAELSELAVTATPESDPDLAYQRARSQAENLFDAGDPPRARQILTTLIADMEAGTARAESLYLLSEFSWKDLPRVSELLEQALVEVGDDVALRSRILADLAWVGLDTCKLVAAAERGYAAVELAEAVGHAYGLRLALATHAMAEFLLGRPATHLLDRAIPLQGELAPADLSSPATCLGRQLMWVGELDRARHTLETELERYHQQGHETACYEILAHLADVEYRSGRFRAATAHLEAANEIAADARVDVLGEILPVMAAVEWATGDLTAARRQAMDGLAVSERTGDRWNEIRCRSVLGMLEISIGDPAAAHTWLEPLPSFTDEMGLAEPGVFPFIPDLVEALIGVGELEQANALTQGLEAQGRARDRALAVGTAERCYGLIAASQHDLQGAEARLENSVRELKRVAQPFELARTLLIAGTIQRRLKQKRLARELLEGARTIFDELHGTLWTEKAEAELARIGGRPPSPKELTPTEKQVAALVAEGRTNREVAQALFLSVHTVEANLKRVFRKLNVRSRTELAIELDQRRRP